MEDIRTATVALKALVELGYPLELSSLIDYLAKSPDSRDELVKFDNEDTLSIFLKKFPSMFWVDGCKVFPAQLKPKGVSKSSNKTRPPQSHSVVQAATDLCDERRGEDQPMGEVEDPDENPKLSCSGEKKEVKLGDTKVGMLDTEGDGPKERNPSKEEVNSKKDGEASAVNQGKVGQEEDESTLNLECSAKQKTEVLNDATTVPFTSTSHTCHAQESQESQQQFPTCESTKESAYMTAMRNLFTKQRKLSIVTIVEELRAVYSEDKIDEGAAHLFLKRHPDMYQLTEDDKVEEQAPVNVMATILKVLKWNALGTLEDGSQVYIPKALYAERMGVACASMRDHLSKGDCILVDTEQGMTSRTAKWTATNIRAIFKSPNVHISNERTKKIDLHTAVPYMLATKAIRSPSELDDMILNFVITIFDKRTECTLQHLNYNMRYLNHDGLLHLRGSGGLLKFLQGHPDKFQIVHTHSVSVNQEHSQFCTNPSNLHLDAECAISEESAMETVVKGTLHQGDKTSSSHSDLSSNPDNQATSESMVTVHKIVDADNIHAQADSATPSITTNCVIGEIHSIVDDFILFYLQNGEKALLSGLKKMQKDTTTNVECLSVGDCILLDVVPGPPGGTQWTVSKMRHTLKKAVPSQIQCAESTATHSNVALKEVLEQLEEQLDTVIAWLTFLSNKVRVSFKDLEACMRDLPKNVQKCTLQKAGPIQFLEQYPSLFHVDIVRSEVCLVECLHTSSTCCGAMLVPKSSSDQDKGVAPVQPPIEGTSVTGYVIATDSSEPRVAAIDQAAVEFFRNKVSEKGKLSIHDLSSCFAVCPMAIRKHVGSSEKGLIKFFKDHADTFLLENEKVVSLMDTSARAMEEAKHDKTAKETVAALPDDKRTADGKNIDVATPSPMSSSSGDSDVIEREALSGTQDVDALLEEGVAHFVEVLKKKGSMPLNRIHGHVNQLREEVKKAIGSGQENVRALFLRFPAYFFIDATDTVHLAQKQQEEKDASRQIEDNKKSEASLLEEGAAHFVAVLKKKGSMPLSRINGHVCQCREEVKKAVGLGPEKARALFLRFPAYFFMDATDTVHLHVASKQQEETESSKSKQRQDDIKAEASLLEEGAAHFVAVLKKKGSLPLSKISGHVCQCREEVKQAVGGGPEKARALFLKFPAYFFIDATDTVHLASKEQEEKEASKQSQGDIKDEAALLEEGAAHFVGILEKKGSMPLSRIFGHVCKCRDEVKQAVGLSPEKARALFLKFPAYFFIDATDTVHLACKQQEEKEASKQTEGEIKSEAELLEEGAAHFVQVLEKKGSIPLSRIHGHMYACKKEVWKAIGGGPENARSLFLKFPSYFHIDSEENVHLTSTVSQEYIKAVSAVLERNGPTHLGELVSHVGFSKPKMSSYFQRNSPKTFLEQHPKIFVIDDNMVYLVSAIKEEGVQYFKKVLELKGSLHIKNLSGHCSQYKYLGPMLEVVGGSPSSVMDFLKGFPEMFSVGDDGMVHLTSATVTQSQGNKSGTDNRSYAMVVETGQKIHLEDKKAKKEGILLEGVQHFKQALESKGSMPLKNIFGHVNQCRNEVKWAIGCSMDNVETFLLKYPGVFHIDKNLMVHLVCNRAQGQQQEQHKTNIKQLPIEEKALAHFKGMLSRKGPSTIHVLSSCFSSCGQDIRRHVGSSKEGLTKFFRKHPQIFKVDANKVVSLHASSTVFKPQRWASCDTLAVPRDTAFPRVLSKLSGSTPDVRSAVDGGTLQQAEEVQDKPSQLPEEDRKDKNDTGDGASTSMPYPQTQHTSDQKADSSNNIPDKFVSAVKNVLSERGCLHIVQLVKELDAILPHERFELSGVRLFLKKCPEDFHVNDQDIVEELPPMNIFAVVNKMLGNNSCFATLEDGSSVFVYIALYRERMGVDCTKLQDHLSPGDILLVDTEHGKPGGSSKWAATNIRGVFKSSKCVDADKNGVNLQTPLHFLPASTIARSPSEIRAVIVKLVASFLRVTSPLQLKDLCSRMKYLNHDAVLYLREKGGLLSFLQSKPEVFQVQDECVTLVAGEGELAENTSQCLACPGAKCTIGEVSVISNNTAHLCLPDDKKAILDLTDAHNSIITSHLSVGDCLVAYINIVPSNQSEIPWEVSEVKCVMEKAVPAQIHAKTATATCGSDRLKEAPQQSVLEGEQQQMEDQTDQENNQQEPGQKLDRAEIEKETLDLIVNLVQKSGQVSLRSLQGHINLLGEEKQDCIKGKGGLLTFLQHHFGTIFKIDSTSENISLRGGQDAHETEADVLTDSSAKGEQLQPSQLTVEEEVEMVRSSPEKTSICVDISDAEDSKKNHNVPMKETGDDIATSVLKTRHNTEDCDDVDISTVVTPSVFVAQETDIVHTPNALLEQYLNEKETVCDSFGLPTATVHPVVPVDSPPGQPDDDFTSLLHMFKDNLSPIQDNLVEVEMDIGRIPIARYYNPASPNLLAPLRLSEETLTRETLETILSALPLDRSATGQGRVLLRGSLHWVSTLKNSSDDIVGLTLRRGQAVPGCLDLLWDMVTSGTSTLIIGRPCSGKTTLLREWARVLSDVCYRRVIVVDTLNEIAGGDDVPHPGVGGARRVQVHNRCQQVSQLQTAARNHSPDCIIVDEVQTQEEVTALQAIRLTGIQVIAGVCAGSLPDLLHNSVMRGLLGMSDPPSSTSASRGVIPQPPTFPHTLPVFQAAVQIHNRDNLSVYSDVASFVRMSLLEGRFPLAQQRKRVVTNGRQTEL